MERSVSHLQRFGLKKNEAYDLLVPDKAWEIERKSLEVNRKLGEGAFGTVYGAEYYRNDETRTCIPVAVKTLHEGADAEQKVRIHGHGKLYSKMSSAQHNTNFKWQNKG